MGLTKIGKQMLKETFVETKDVFNGSTFSINGVPVVLADGTGSFVTANSGTTPGMWVKLQSTTITEMYQYCNATIAVHGGADALPIYSKATVDLRVKQQTALGTAPIITLVLTETTDISKDDFITVTTKNDSTNTVVELWFRISKANERYQFGANVLNTNAKVSFYSAYALTTALPNGAKTFCDDEVNIITQAGTIIKTDHGLTIIPYSATATTNILTECAGTSTSFWEIRDTSDNTRYAVFGKINSASNNVYVAADKANLILQSTSAAGNFGVDIITTDGGYGTNIRGKQLSVRNNANTAYMPVLASAFTVNSEAAVKENIQELVFMEGSALATIQSTTPKSYYLKEEKSRLGKKAKRRIGLILEESPPEIVDEDGVNLYEMCTTLWKGVSEIVDCYITKEEKTHQDTIQRKIDTILLDLLSPIVGEEKIKAARDQIAELLQPNATLADQ